MQNEFNAISQYFFQKETTEQVQEDEIRGFIAKYPYAAPARILLAKYNYSATEIKDEVVTAGLYVHNTLRLQALLSNEPETSAEERERPRELIAEKLPEVVQPSVEDTSPIAFQSYHTIDYFASQGIRLLQAELAKDKLGQQLKSFTDWLRSMKKLPSSQLDLPQNALDTGLQQNVIRSAAHSIEEKEVLTETMAEVWAKQGNHSKAIDIYSKLSLQNPGKSAYFAAKIDQLK